MPSHLNQTHMLISHKIGRFTLILVNIFAALSALTGGVALIAKVEQFPLEWLQNTPFSSYLIPGLILTIVVGGSALVATVTMLTGHSIGVIVSLVAGFMMVGWIIGEVAMLFNSSWLHPFYFAIGLVSIGLAVWLWVTEFQHTL